MDRAISLMKKAKPNKTNKLLNNLTDLKKDMKVIRKAVIWIVKENNIMT